VKVVILTALDVLFPHKWWMLKEHFQCSNLKLSLTLLFCEHVFNQTWKLLLFVAYAYVFNVIGQTFIKNNLEVKTRTIIMPLVLFGYRMLSLALWEENISHQ
jgi:uncharacterized membrane protein